MPRPLSSQVRSALIDRAAALLAKREPVTIRTLLADTGLSTMAVYTYFGGMPGLWAAVRQEGFTRLRVRLEGVAARPNDDAVRHLATLGVAYVEHALANPDLYRVMFDSAFDLPDPDEAAATFSPLVDGVQRAQAIGQLSSDADAESVATRYWASGHGVTSLAVSGVIPLHELPGHAQALTVGVFTAAGADPARTARSVSAAWRNAQARFAGSTRPG